MAFSRSYRLSAQGAANLPPRLHKKFALLESRLSPTAPLLNTGSPLLSSWPWSRSLGSFRLSRFQIIKSTKPELVKLKLKFCSLPPIRQSNPFSQSLPSYTICLGNIGFEPATGTKRFFGVGFNNFLAGVAGPTGTTNNSSYRWDNSGNTLSACAWANANVIFKAANTAMNTDVPACSADVGTGSCHALGFGCSGASALTCLATQNTFLIGAAESVLPSPSGVYDGWRIDKGRNLVNTLSGI